MFEALNFDFCENVTFEIWKCQKVPKIKISELLNWLNLQFFGLQSSKWPKLISPKIWLAEKSWNFNTVWDTQNIEKIGSMLLYDETKISSFFQDFCRFKIIVKNDGKYMFFSVCWYQVFCTHFGKCLRKKNCGANSSRFWLPFYDAWNSAYTVSVFFSWNCSSLAHNVEISGFFCHSDFMWNQFKGSMSSKSSFLQFGRTWIYFWSNYSLMKSAKMHQNGILEAQKRQNWFHVKSE